MKMTSKNEVVLISGCLLGLSCNYKAKASPVYLERLSPLIDELVAAGIVFLPVCPEQQGGMPTPRIPSELQDDADSILAGQGKILNREGEDVTGFFIKGAEESLRMARLYQVRLAILKSRSPSCGSKGVYDGTFSGKLVKGRGIAAALLQNAGLKVFDEQEFEELAVNKGFLRVPQS